MGKEPYKLSTLLTDLIQREDVRIFIDTCSMMKECFDSFLSALIPLLDVNHKKLVIPYSCLQELKKHEDSFKLKKQAKSAVDSLQLISEYIDIRGNENDGSFADNVFLRVFTQFRTKYNLILISEDKNLKADLLKLNNSKSVHGKRIYVFNTKEALSLDRKEAKKETFKMNTFELTTVSDAPVTLSYLPQEGDFVHTIDGKSIKLVENLKAGGEGIIYKVDIDCNLVAKIYLKGKFTKRKEAKISTLISKNIKIDGVCLPTGLIYNDKNEAVGYLMPFVQGTSLDASVFRGERGFLRHFPKWTRNDLIDLCITIVTTIQKLHNKGIIIGDINGSNILVETATKVNFVDTDSFQVDGFPCPVGKEDYTAPEIQGKKYDSFLRSESNENFAIATLLFTIFMFGKKPYAKIGGGNTMQDIKDGDFSYPYKENSNHKMPEGDWKYLWSHLHPAIKRTFYYTFRKGESLYDEDKRPNTRNWLKLLKQYKVSMSNGYLANVDKASLELFPKTYKKAQGHTYATCYICGKETDTEYMRDGKYCYDCLNETSQAECKSCHEIFTFKPNYRQYILHKSTPPDLCPECIEKKRQEKKKEQLRRNEVFMTRTCQVCGKTFAISKGEHDYLVSKGLNMPKRCKDCRNNNRHKTYESHHSGGSSSGDSGWCYITTAVCNYYGKPDDCMELTKLRYFRDNWLMKQENGPLDVSVYYDCAPALVEKMVMSPDYAETCETIMNEYIQPCIKMIDAGKNSECREKYFELVKFMIKKYN